MPANERNNIVTQQQSPPGPADGSRLEKKPNALGDVFDAVYLYAESYFIWVTHIFGECRGIYVCTF